MTPCTVIGYRRFEGTYCLHIQGKSEGGTIKYVSTNCWYHLLDYMVS
jgi:hypothetical protein